MTTTSRKVRTRRPRTAGMRPALPHADAAMVRDVGASIRSARDRCGLTVDGVAALAGLAPDELLAIENGSRRASAETLLILAQVLRVRIARFFGSIAAADIPEAARPSAVTPGLPMHDIALMSEAFARIADPAMRQTVLDVMRAVAGVERSSGRMRRAGGTTAPLRARDDA